MAEWRDIETAPKDGEPILLSDGHMTVQGWWLDDSYPWYFVDQIEHEDRGPQGCWIELNQGKETTFTHWQPLPAPPEPSK
jgi:hypothetical protein